MRLEAMAFGPLPASRDWIKGLARQRMLLLHVLYHRPLEASRLAMVHFVLNLLDFGRGLLLASRYQWAAVAVAALLRRQEALRTS